MNESDTLFAAKPQQVNYPQKLIERFWDKVAKAEPTECWVWMWGKRNGYGRIKWKGKDYGTHRLSWEITFGSIPVGLCVLHDCDNRPCCNPSHLFLGTNLDNIADKVAKGRQKEAMPHGSSHYAAKITETQVAEIRRRRATGEYLKDIAADFGMTASSIHVITTRRQWKHVP